MNRHPLSTTLQPSKRVSGYAFLSCEFLQTLRKLSLLFVCTVIATSIDAIDLKRCKIVHDPQDAPLVAKMATTLSEDICRVTGVTPTVVERMPKGHVVVLCTIDKLQALVPGIKAEELRGTWERYKIITRGNQLIVVGSDARGLAYGVLHISERIGVSPWYWWADIPVSKKSKLDYRENYISHSPTVKYRGFFINDEDWGLKTWAAENFEKELKDIGPKTYDKVCELILRLKGNMLAPAMHTCTGAFYSHPESQVAADAWGIMITTSHCEPMLFNNAAPSEWTKERDGEWNYLTNQKTIWKKFDDRLQQTSQYDNIYTMGMRGLHDEAMKGSTDPKDRAHTLERVFADQREILERHKKKPITEIPQIFVPYKETLDIYDAGLRVPEDITLVWPDDNYGYMKRVSNAAERQRKGGAGVYYHLSYLGTPHDYIWIATTAPALMYEELKKAHDAGADRYWLLNVGDIKPMEIEIQQFFEMAWDINAFNYDNANRFQSKWLASIFGSQYENEFQQLLDTYYRLAWQRKPEYMGYEIQWDSPDNERLHDSDFSFADGTAQRRLSDYQSISDRIDKIMAALPSTHRPALFEMLGYSVKSAHQMNRKFLMAQRNHETGSEAYAREARQANDSLMSLLNEYNHQLDGKWNRMMPMIPPGIVSQYQKMPELVQSPTDRFRLPQEQHYTILSHMLSLRSISTRPPFRLIEGMGPEWTALQLGEPLDAVQDPTAPTSHHIDIHFDTTTKADSVRISISAVPMWPITRDRSNRFGVSVDGATPIVCENRFEEWSAPWKRQVLENRKDFHLIFPINNQRQRHTLTLIIGDPGQIVQHISFAETENH